MTIMAALKHDCVSYASRLGDYQKLSCDELANGYCEAKDKQDKTMENIYISALILRFWYTIDKMYMKCPNIGMEREEFVGWLIEAIDYACKYRAWQNPEKHVNAQQAINKCIGTIRLQHYYDFNLQKNRANFNNASLDMPLGNSDGADHVVTLGDTISDQSYEQEQGNLNAKSMIQYYINKKKIIDAIIMDTIAFNDVEKRTKKTIKTVDDEGNQKKHTEITSTFWPYKLVQLLGTLPEDYMSYFSKKYTVVTAELEASLNAIRTANNQKLYKYLDACLKSLRSDCID